jgi:hypothetical protein
LEKDPEEAADLAAQLPDRLEEMKAKALEIEASIDASELGEDYPEGKVLQPQRSEKWEEMPEYRKLFPTFQKLKPTWEPPSGSKK